MANGLKSMSPISNRPALAWLPLVSFFFVAGCNAEPATRAAQCQANFLSKDGAWEARAFNGKVLRPSTPTALGTFVPIEKIYVQAGKLYVQTWATEPVGTTIKAAPAGIAISPLYMVWLGTEDDDVGREAKKLVPYGGKNVRHILSISGNCKEPPILEVNISLSPGKKEQKVLLRKVATKRKEF